MRCKENRSALIVLAFHGKGLAALAPEARAWPPARRHVVTLAGRSDLPQHFTISAVLAATAGSPLSDVVGLYKELDDARHGSGFSFNDLAADRAGTRLGALAAGAAAGRERLRKTLVAGLSENDLIPRGARLAGVHGAGRVRAPLRWRRTTALPGHGRPHRATDRRLALVPLRLGARRDRAKIGG